MPQKKNNEMSMGKKLHLAVEKRLKEKQDAYNHMSPEDIKLIMHELHGHYTELEMQNKQLEEARQAMQLSLNRYSNLFNFAPVAYLILNQEGIVLDVNDTATHLFGVDKTNLINTKLDTRVLSQYKENYFIFFRKAFKSPIPESCELKLAKDASNSFTARLICSQQVSIEESPKTKTCTMAIIDITEQQKAKEIISSAMDEKERLNIILQTQETERKRIAEALHNGVGQLLYTIKIKVDKLTKDIPMKKDSMEVKSLIKEAIMDIKNISYELVPTIIEDFGLEAVINKLSKNLFKADIACDLHIYGYNKRMPLNLEISIYRIIQELFNNIIKHSSATQTTVNITINSSNIFIRVEDNGIGCADTNSKDDLSGMGLKNINNRVQLLNGEIEFNSSPGKGMAVIIKIPSNNHEKKL